uniref:Uncharacterized protein n=1 Tax=Chelydra serpentina TaxID=8475 RepID=A0A8C3S8Y6_CHESE
KLPLYSPGIALKGPKQKQPNWKQSKGSSPSLGVLTVPSPAATLEPTDYLERYKRALQSQVSPGLTLWLRKATTKEVGVQVNPQVDPRCSAHGGPTSHFSLAAPAVYSPGLDWRLFTLPEAAEPKAAQEAPPMALERKEGADGEQAAWQPEEEPGERNQGVDTAPTQQSQQEETEEQVMTEIFLFQFLEQKYGYFHCKDCKTRWESSYVWCISGGNNWVLYDIDLKRPRQELGGHCKSKRLSRDNTYRFKYIV